MNDILMGLISAFMVCGIYILMLLSLSLLGYFTAQTYYYLERICGRLKRKFQ